MKIDWWAFSQRPMIYRRCLMCWFFDWLIHSAFRLSDNTLYSLREVRAQRKHTLARCQLVLSKEWSGTTRLVGGKSLFLLQFSPCSHRRRVIVCWFSSWFAYIISHKFTRVELGRRVLPCTAQHHRSLQTIIIIIDWLGNKQPTFPMLFD